MKFNHESDKELVHRIRHGSPTEKQLAEKVLFWRYRDDQLNYLQRQESLSLEEALEAYQVSTSQALMVARKEEVESYKNLLFSISDRRTIDLIRKREARQDERNQPLVTYLEPEAFSRGSLVPGSLPTVLNLWYEVKERVFALFSKDLCRELLLLHAEGYTLKEIAKMNKAKGNQKLATYRKVQSRRKKCKEALIQKMKATDPDLIDLLVQEKDEEKP